MALTPLQIEILRLLAERRRHTGESYVAGGVALNLAIKSRRRSRDIDLFHDSDQALRESWAADHHLLRANGYTVTPLHETPVFIEAYVNRNSEPVLVQWARDSAFRFYPLVEDDLLGLTLHPFDLATNKVLALAGRLEPRDWVDMLGCHNRIQHLGYLTWAACGKDPGFSPEAILDVARRQHYAQAEIDLLDFDGPPPSAAELGVAWKRAIAEAGTIVRALPEDCVGHCLVDMNGQLYDGSVDLLLRDLGDNNVQFRAGTIGGVLPIVAE